MPLSLGIRLSISTVAKPQAKNRVTTKNTSGWMRPRGDDSTAADVPEM